MKLKRRLIPALRGLVAAVPTARILCPLVLGAGSLAAAPESSPTPGTNTPPPTSAYVDRPIPDQPAFHDAPSSLWHGPHWQGSPWPYRDGAWSLPESYRTRTTIYFPPVLPALGDPLPSGTARVLHDAPVALAAFLGENFYAPLSSELWENDLPKRMHARVERYQTTRDAAADALRAELARIATLPSAARSAALASFATAQAPALATLEAEAEAIRADLVEGSWFNSAVHWNRSRDWRLGDDLRWESDLDEFKVMRGAIFYEGGLSLEQRDLLREITYDLIEAMLRPHAAIDLSGPRPALHLPPGAARVRLPADLPAELAARIDRYRTERHALKTELRRTVYERDRGWSHRRRAVFRELAAQQAPRFALLEALAEEIRAGLVEVPGVLLTGAGAAAPTDLTLRIEAYLQEKTALQHALTARLDELRTRHPQARVELVRQPVGYGIAFTPPPEGRFNAFRRAPVRPGANDATGGNALQAEIATFNAAQEERFRHLAAEKDAIERATRAHLQTQQTSAPGRSIDALLRDFNEDYTRQEQARRYEDYQTAMLLPGLSPAQRRLLFNAGLRRLELPLSGATP